MPVTRELITIDPSGKSMIVEIFDEANASVTCYTTLSGGTAHTFPLTITTRTDFFLTRSGTYSVSAKVGDAEIAGVDGEMAVVTPHGTPIEVKPTLDDGEELDVAAAVTQGGGSLVAPTTGDAGKFVAVREDETGYELVDAPAGGGSFVQFRMDRAGATSGYPGGRINVPVPADTSWTADGMVGGHIALDAGGSLGWSVRTFAAACEVYYAELTLTSRATPANTVTIALDNGPQVVAATTPSTPVAFDTTDNTGGTGLSMVDGLATVTDAGIYDWVFSVRVNAPSS